MEQNNSTNSDKVDQKQRHGCVTTWLVLMVISNSLITLVYLFAGDFISDNIPGGISKSMMTILAILGIANVICSFLILKWKKLGFWGFLITSIGALFINIASGLSIGQSIFGLAGVGILYAVLQIKNNEKTAWMDLE